MDSLSVVLKRKRDEEERLRRSDPLKNIIIGEDGVGGNTSSNPAEALTAAVESLNGLTGDVTLANGDNITITIAGQTITIAATVPEVTQYEPLTNGDEANPAIVFFNGNVIMAEV